MDVLLATCAALPGLYHDDRNLLPALADRGLEARPAVWEDEREDWSAAKLCVVRSVWDYSYRPEQFMQWAERTAGVTNLWNSASAMRWNLHKRYLCELAAHGVPVVPTTVLEVGSDLDLRETLEDRGWSKAVIKAAVAQAGRYAMLVHGSSISDGQAHVDRLLPHEDMLLQPCIEAVADTGELSVVIIDGQISHAVRKRSVGGDFRVHSDWGGSVQPEEPSREHIEVTNAALEVLGEKSLFARVDLVDDPATGPLIMEFEVIDPELFLAHSEVAVQSLTEAIERELDR